jgi:hypothetical protein
MLLIKKNREKERESFINSVNNEKEKIRLRKIFEMERANENEVIMKTIEIENELTKKINSGYLNEKSRVRITFIKTTDKITEKNYVLSKNNYIFNET